MKAIETKHLILQKFREDDFAAVHSYASNLENVVYMPFGPNTEDDTKAFISMAISEAEKVPCKNYYYAVMLKDSGMLIGSCDIGYRNLLSTNEAEMGWLLHRDYWNQGYGSEVGEALLDFGFEEMNLHRIVANCDAENIASFRVMEKIGMRREGLFLESRPAHKFSANKYGDTLTYAILRREREIRRPCK